MAPTSSKTSSSSVFYSMASASSQIDRSSTISTSLSTRHDVFLSFRGTDTRDTFTSFLYDALNRNGIRTFMDDPELRTGEVISDALLKAIKESKAYVVVFSENYASSSWCLDELVEIYKYCETMKRSVIGVYYKIDPSVVRHQTGSFKKAFRKHESRYKSKLEKVTEWRRVLKNVAGVSGKSTSAKRSEVEIVNEIVDAILQEINPKTLDIAKYPVGLDSRVKDITALLSSESEGVIKIGIYGMGGVGKTTLAKAVYNQLLLRSFKGRLGTCFLANIREVSSSINGRESLQQQLINDVLESRTKVEVRNVEEGTRSIKERICSEKILVLIDDIDDIKQYECLVGPFASGSVVIITTRDEEILHKIGVDPRFRYRVNELGDAESLALFTKHAFGDDTINRSLMALSKDIILHAGGLPLALEVFGSYLYRRSEVGWESFIDKLQRVPNSSIQERLIISLNALESDDPMLKNIFLDIACFFIGRKKEEVVIIMKTCYSFVDFNIYTLMKRSLLTINDRDELRMHDLLRDMGRQVARNNSYNEPGRYSRLWASEEIFDVLKNHKGTETIEGIIYHDINNNDAPTTDSFSTETFRRMSKLRFLHLEGVHLTGSFEHVFKDLKWLCWDRCPLNTLPSDYLPEKLVILDLPRSEIKTMWELNMVFEKLKTLNMSYSQDLTTTPDFTKLPFLETLNLEHCEKLVEVHRSVGSLKRLVSLDLGFCRKLKRLPDSICELRALEVLNTLGCYNLEVLPAELGNIESLKKLNVGGLNVWKSEESITRLVKIVQSQLNYYNKLINIPANIPALLAAELESMLIGCFNYGEALTNERQNTDPQGTQDTKLPDSITRLSKLVELRLSHYLDLETLPDTICNLTSLEILDVSMCDKLETLPDQLWNITSLREIDARGATLLKRLPDIQPGQIASSLKKLNLSESVLTSLPSGISQLTELEDLDLTYCHHLLSITELPPNLKRIRAYGCMSVERLPNLSFLKQLEILDLTDCSSLTMIVGLEELTSIIELHLGGCNSGLAACTSTESFFQIYSGLGHETKIYVQQVPGWITQLSNSSSTVSLDLLPNVSQNFAGMILCIKPPKINHFLYDVKNTTSDFKWSGVSVNEYIMMAIVPRSVFSVRDGDERIELTANADAEILGIHLLHIPEIHLESATTTELDVSKILTDEDHRHQDKFLKRSSCFHWPWK